MSKLDEYLKAVDPSKTIDYYSAQLDKAINSYEYSKSAIKDVDQLMSILSNFYWHIEGRFCKVDGRFNPEEKWKQGLCENILREIYGDRCRIIVFEMATTGVGGGVFEIFRKIGDAVAQEWIKKKIDYEATMLINALKKDFNEFLKAIDEYADRFGHLIPKRFTENNYTDLKLEFYEVLKNHPYMIKRMREIGKA